MNKELKYEILKGLPAYGPMYIPVTENGESFSSEGFIVRFFKSDGSNWVANFKEGWTELNAVYEFEDQVNILVIAGGTCYIMNPEKQTPIRSFGAGYQTVIKAPKNRLVLQDSTDLTIIEANGEIWHTERISWDGIKELNIEGELINGLSLNPMSNKDEWIEFVVDLEKRNVKGGSFRQFEIVEQSNNNSIGWMTKLKNKIKGSS